MKRPSDHRPKQGKPTQEKPSRERSLRDDKDNPEGYRLNKFIAHAGLCSRREAAEWVKAGKIKVNGKVEKNPAVLVSRDDNVEYQGNRVMIEDKMVYILMNKPKDTITTVSDDKNRRTVMDLLQGKVDVRLYPVGRLDRNTTGLLLLTNDGELTKKLTHPSHEVKKIYHVFLDREFAEKDLAKLRKGIKLEDGFIKPDKVDPVKNAGANEVGVEIHSGRNRIVRRMFEALDYRVLKLDRVYFAGLTKKDLPRGRFRHLTEREIIMLKHFT